MSQPAADPADSESTGARLACPRCGHDLVRARRRPLDRLLSLITPTHRYRCREHECQWEGTIRVEPTDPSP